MNCINITNSAFFEGTEMIQYISSWYTAHWTWCWSLTQCLYTLMPKKTQNSYFRLYRYQLPQEGTYIVRKCSMWQWKSWKFLGNILISTRFWYGVVPCRLQFSWRRKTKETIYKKNTKHLYLFSYFGSTTKTKHERCKETIATKQFIDKIASLF